MFWERFDMVPSELGMHLCWLLNIFLFFQTVIVGESEFCRYI